MSILEDVRFALRVLAKRPWLTAMMTLVLAAGIGVNTTVFTLFNAVLVRGLPFPDGERLLFLESVEVAEDQAGRAVSYPDFDDWREQTREFQSLAAYSNGAFNLSDDTSAPQRAPGTRISREAFGLLRMEPVLGRAFVDDEHAPGQGDVILLSHGLWRDRYGADPDIVGKTVRVDERSHTVVGVMPPRFQFPTEAELWLPLTEEAEEGKRDARWLGVFGRLADGATRDSAQNELKLATARLADQYPETNDGMSGRVLTGNERFNGGNIEMLFLAMLGAVGFLLLIACANVANVQLTRAADREREISIRTALGAGRRRIVRQLLIESVMLSTAGGVLGLAFCYVGVTLFDNATIEQRPYFIDFRFDGVVFAYLAAVCLATGVLFGLAPAVHALRTNVNASLKEGGRGQTSGAGARRFSTAMVIGQAALSVVLLTGAGLMVRSFWNVHRMDAGAATEDRLVGLVVLPEAKYAEDEDRLAFFEAMLPKLRSLPGATGVTMTSHLPQQGYAGRAVEVEGSPVDDPEQRPREGVITIGPDYFQTVGVTLLRGRDFRRSDRQDAPQVAIVNRRFAEKYWPDEDAVGKRLKVGDEEDRAWLTVVGMSPDIRQNGPENEELQAVVYRPYAQSPTGHSYFVIHSPGGPEALSPAFRQATAEVDPNLPVQDVMPLDRRLERSRWAYTVFGSAFSLFGVIALGMAALGVFALAADSARRRIPEFGVRLAFGAAPGQILRLALSQALRRVVIGLAVGLPAAYAASRMLESVLVGVEPFDAATMAAVSAFLLATTLAACWLPARRASRLDAAAALRQE